MAKLCGVRLSDSKSPEWKEMFFTKLSEVRRRKLSVLVALQGGRCCHCGEEIRLAHKTHAGNRNLPAATLDHIVPQVQGGTDAISNLAAACGDCNADRGSEMEFEAFQALRRNPTAWAEHLLARARRGCERNRSKAERKYDALIVRMAAWTHLFPWMAPEFERAALEADAEFEGKNAKRRMAHEAKLRRAEAALASAVQTAACT